MSPSAQLLCVVVLCAIFSGFHAAFISPDRLARGQDALLQETYDLDPAGQPEDNVQARGAYLMLRALRNLISRKHMTHNMKRIAEQVDAEQVGSPHIVRRQGYASYSRWRNAGPGAGNGAIFDFPPPKRNGTLLSGDYMPVFP